MTGGADKMTEEQKEKYANFLNKVSEILGLNKLVDVLRLCAVTDEYFKPIEKHIAELEKENAELKTRVANQKSFIIRIREKFNLGEIDRKEIEGYLESDQLAKAKELLSKLSQLKHRADDPFTCDEYLKLISETEMFLKEVSE